MPRAENTKMVESIEQFFERYYSDEISDLAAKYPDEQRSLYVDWADIYRYDANLADDFLSQPTQMIEFAEMALQMLDLPADVTLGQAHIRITNLPESTPISGIRSRHVNMLVSVQGTVERASSVRSELQHGAFECQRCGTLTYIPQSTYGDRQDPYECQGCERQGPFEVNDEQSEYVDAQTLLLKQLPSNVTTGDEASITVELRDDIAGEVTPGETVTVTGVPEMLDASNQTDASIADKYFAAHSVTIASDEYLTLDITDDDKRKIIELSTEGNIYKQMVGSFAPSIYGYEQEKLAVLLQMFSGVTKHLPDGARIRGDLHVALIGDPATAKSRLLDYAGALAPRTVSVSGTGSSPVGLTAAMKRTSTGSKPWAVEAGALPLADGGLACVDNLDHFNPEHRQALASVLEDQIVTINKATVSATLKARTSVLAAASPKYGRFDQYEPIGEQVDLEPGVISQFDLIFTVTDDPDEHHDEQVAEHILQANYAGELNTQQTEIEASLATSEEVETATEPVTPDIDPVLLRKYIAYARQNCFPSMTDDAMETIKDFYVNLRSKGVNDDAPVPVTARKLEALVRLAEASARIRLSDKVVVEDAERAVKITRSCLRDLGVDPETGQFDVDVAEADRRENLTEEQRERIQNIKQLINDVQTEYDEGAPVDVVINSVEELGMDQSKTEHEIDKLKQKGEVYEPVTDHLRTT